MWRANAAGDFLKPPAKIWLNTLWLEPNTNDRNLSENRLLGNSMLFAMQIRGLPSIRNEEKILQQQLFI